MTPSLSKLRSLVCLLVVAIPLIVSSQSVPNPYFTYGQLSHRTVLQPAALPRIVITNLPPDTNAAIAMLEAAFSKAGIEVVTDGEKFVRIFPATARSHFEKSLSEIKAPTNGGPVFLRRMDINFSSATLDQTLAIYCEYRQRTALQPVSLPHPTVLFQNQTELSSDEVRYAFEVLLAINGIAVVNDGEKFMQIVPYAEKSQVETNAPKPDAKERLIAKERIPVFDQIPPSLRAVQRPPPPPPPPFGQQLAKAVVDLYKELASLRKAPQFPATVDAMFEFYGRLADRKTVMGTQTNQIAAFKAVTPLTKPELIYAVETTLKLQNVAIVPVDDKTVRTMNLREARELQKKKAASPSSPTGKSQ